MGKAANISLWILQALLALWNITGAVYMMGHHSELANAWALSALPGSAWIILGSLQILLALGIIVPDLLKMSHKYITVSAAGLAVISLLGIALYISYAGFPGMLWGVLPAILAALAAYGRHPERALVPLR